MPGRPYTIIATTNSLVSSDTEDRARGSLAVLVTGDHFSVVESRAGTLVATTIEKQVGPRSDDGGDEGETVTAPILIRKEDRIVDGDIVAARFSRDDKYLAVCTRDKGVYVYRVEDWSLVGHTVTPKRGNAVVIDPMNEHVIVGDKFGDAFGAKISDAGSEGQQDVVSVLGKPECLLGHVSILTDLGFTWSKNGSREYILSADRDEKIRISRYPNTYNIESYCLGHTAFVTTICTPRFAPLHIVSGGGDATVRVWEIAGPGGSKEVQKLEMMPVIEKYFGKEKLPNSDEVAVLKIRATRGKDGSSVPPLVAVLVEFVPMVFVYQWNDERQNLTQIPTDVIKFDEGTVVRDIEWDGEHKLWAVTEESGVKVYRSDYDDEWVEDKQVVENIGKLELPQVDTVERAKSVFEWGRKIIKRKREGDDDGDDDDDDDDDGEGGENGQE